MELEVRAFAPWVCRERVIYLYMFCSRRSGESEITEKEGERSDAIDLPHHHTIVPRSDFALGRTPGKEAAIELRSLVAS